MPSTKQPPSCILPRAIRDLRLAPIEQSTPTHWGQLDLGDLLVVARQLYYVLSTGPDVIGADNDNYVRLCGPITNMNIRVFRSFAGPGRPELDFNQMLCWQNITSETYNMNGVDAFWLADTSRLEFTTILMEEGTPVFYYHVRDNPDDYMDIENLCTKGLSGRVYQTSICDQGQMYCHRQISHDVINFVPWLKCTPRRSRSRCRVEQVVSFGSVQKGDCLGFADDLYYVVATSVRVLGTQASTVLLLYGGITTETIPALRVSIDRGYLMDPTPFSYYRLEEYSPLLVPHMKGDRTLFHSGTTIKLPALTGRYIECTPDYSLVQTSPDLYDTLVPS
jgi:hypothetical protein